MRGGIAIMLGLFALAAAIAFHGVAGRYEIATGSGAIPRRIDRLTGEVCTIDLTGAKVLDCDR